MFALKALLALALAADAPQLAPQTITLENGLRVVSLEDHSTPIVAVQLWYHVGSKDEDPGRQGFAHMFEHMMFRGTDRLGATDHFDLIRRVGGDCNAYTAFDQTVYVQTLPASQLELALWLEAERMSFLKVDQEGFDTERKVVEEERRLGLNQPYGTALENALKAIFTVHPYRWSPIGNIPHLRAASTAELRAFWQKWYVPNNATLVVVGDVTHEQVQTLARKTLGWIPRGDDLNRAIPEEPPLDSPKEIVLREDNAPTPGVGVLFRTVPIGHPDEPALEVLASILGSGESSRLYRALVSGSKQAVVAQALAVGLEDEGIFAAGAVLPPIGSQPAEVEKVLQRELEKLRAEPVTAEELTKARNQALLQRVQQLLTVESKAQVIGQAAVFKGDAAAVNREYAEIQALTAEKLQQVARTHLDSKRAYTITVPRNLLGALFSRDRSEEGAQVTATPETTPPAPGRPGVERPEGFPAEPPMKEAVPTLPTPESSETVLPNGLRVIVVPNREVPYVSMSLRLFSGAWTEEVPGTASLALSMLTRGTAKQDQAALATELETYAINLSGSAGSDSASVLATCLPEHLDRAATKLGEVVFSPTFPADELATLKTQVLTNLTMQQRTPEYLAGREWRRRLFGAHPYGRDAEGDAETVGKLTRDDLASWWKTFARPDRAAVIVSGDVTPERALELAKATFGDWKAEGAAPAPSLPPMPPAEPTKIYLVDRPGVQAQIAVAGRGVGYQSPDWPLARVASDYFGGSFSSRLNDVIRVQKGLTYGASGGFDADRFAGTFVVRTFSKTETTTEAVKAVVAEIKRFRDEPPTARELTTTQSSILGSFPARRETPAAVAEDLWTIVLNDLPKDFFARTLAGIGKATAEESARFVRAAVDPDRLVIVVVGDADKLAGPLGEVAPVEVIKD